MDVPVLCWVLSINKPISEVEYNLLLRAAQEAWPDVPAVQKFTDAPKTLETLREILTHIIPLLMMRQQRVPRSKWKMHQTERGKKWIERDPEGMHPSRHLASMMGYATCSEHNMVVMTAAQGKRHQVANIGLSIKRCAFEGPSVQQWAQSLAHKLTQNEIGQLSSLTNEQLLNRLIIILTIKESLISGLGQPVGFDLSRIDCSVPENSVRVDGQPLLGWEFRLVRSVQQGVSDSGQYYWEPYQITVAFYRANNISKIIFTENPKDVERVMQYFTLENLIKVLPKIMQD